MGSQGKRWKQQCDGKKPYMSPGHAGDILNRMVWKNTLDIYDFSIYPCRHCGYWHFGKTRYVRYDKGPEVKPEKSSSPVQEAPRFEQLVLLRRSKSKRIILYTEKDF